MLARVNFYRPHPKGGGKVIFLVCSHVCKGGGMGTPIWLRGGGGLPIQVPPSFHLASRGIPHPASGVHHLADGGTSILLTGGYPPVRTGWGYPPFSRTGRGTSPHPGLEGGKPPPNPGLDGSTPPPPPIRDRAA